MMQISVKIVKLVFLFCFFVITFSCNFKPDTRRFTIVKSNVSPQYEKFSNLKFDGKDYFLIGKNKKTYNSIFYQNLDEKFHNWKLIDSSSLQGVNKLFYFDEDKFFFINEDSLGFTKIYSQEKKNGKINLINSFEESVIKFFYPNLENDSYALIINNYENGSLHSKGNKLLKINSDEVIKEMDLNQNVQKPFYIDGKIYFIGFPDKILNVNTTTFEIELIHLKGIKILDFKLIGGNDYLILGQQNDKITLKKYTNGELVNYDYFSSLSSEFKAEKLHVYNKFIGVLTFTVDKGLIGGLGATANNLHVSYDGGVNWEIIELPIDYYVKPNIFYKDEKFISYSGSGRFSIIDIREGNGR